MAELRLVGVVTGGDWYSGTDYARDETFNLVNVRKVLDNTEKNDDLNIYIDSPGGEIEAGGKIVAEIRSWMGKNPKSTVTITIGGYACSMAAALLVMLPKKIKILVNPDSLVMYHSCYGFFFGSPEEVRDQTEYLDSWNDNVKAAILVKTTLEPETVDTWFRAGREGWLNSQEIIDCGLADGYASTEFVPRKMPKAPGKASNSKVAAMYAAVVDIVKRGDAKRQEQKKENNNMTIEKLLARVEELEEEMKNLKAQIQAEETEETTEETEETTEETKETTEETEETTEETEETTEETEETTEETEETTEEEETVDQLKARIAELEKANQKLTKAFKRPISDKIENAPTNWKDVVAKIPQDEHFDDNYLAAQQKYPQLFKKFMDENQKRSQ